MTIYFEILEHYTVPGHVTPFHKKLSEIVQ